MNADERRFEMGRGKSGKSGFASMPSQRMVRLLSVAAGAAMLTAALFVLVAWRPAAGAGGGRLIGLVRDPAMATEYLAHVDAVTGALSPVGEGIPGCCTPVGLDGALDAAGRRYYAVVTLDAETAPRIVSFNADTGAATVGATVATTAAVNFLAYDSATARLLALLFDSGASRQRLAVLSPTTGAVTWLGDGIAGCCSVTPAFDSALDETNRRLYAVMRPFTGTAAVLYGVDLDTGSVATAISLSSTASINFLAMDTHQGQLWAVANDPQSDAQRLGILDPSTGVIALRGEGAAGCCNLFPTDAAIDSAAGAMVAPMLDGNATARLYGFDLATGRVVHQPVIGGSLSLHYLAYLPAPANSLFLPLIRHVQMTAREGQQNR